MKADTCTEAIKENKQTNKQTKTTTTKKTKKTKSLCAEIKKGIFGCGFYFLNNKQNMDNIN